MTPKPTTIQDVADALGMHKSTVSLALSGKGNLAAATRERVIATAREMGFEPDPVAQRLAQGQSKSLVCLLTGVLDVGLATQKIVLLQSSLSSLGLEAPIYTSAPASRGGAEAQVLQARQLCRQRPRAILRGVQGLHDTVFPVLQQYQESGGIVVAYDLPSPLECDHVLFDREDNAYQAARVLLNLGHQRIGLAMSNSSRQDHPHSTQMLRRTGFRRALQEAGVPVREDWVFHNSTYEAGGVELAERFLSLPERPTGLCIVNDYVALAFMAEVHRAGVRIPRDLSVVGHDDQPIARYCPAPLTCLSQPVDQIVGTVVELLAARLSGLTEPPRTVEIRGALTRRDSTAPAPRVLASS